MKKIAIILSLSLLFTACYNDDSELANKQIIEIGIANDVKDTINIYFNDVLTINTEIDAGASKELSYQWGVGAYKQTQKEDAYGDKYIANTTVFKTVSTDKNLEYIPRELGHYMVRQLVTNEHGSTIKYHHLFVNSPFEEGFIILSRDPQGVGNLSFLKTLTPEEEEAGMEAKFKQNVYFDVNGEKQNSDPVDIFKINNAVYILYGSSQRMSQLNAKTMERIVEFDFKFYNSTFVPTSRSSYDGKYCREVVVASLNGGMAVVQLVDFGIFPFTGRLPEGYNFTHLFTRPSYFSSQTMVFLSGDRNVACMSGFRPNETFSALLACDDYFADKEVMHVFQDADNNLSVINKQNGRIKISHIGSTVFSFATQKLDLQFEYDIPYQGMIDDNTEFLCNDLYSCVFFSYKNGIYKWYSTQDNTMPPANDKFCELPEGEEIRSIAHYVVPRSLEGVDYRVESKNRQSEIYVATYNPDREGEYKGSLYVFSSATGKEITRHEGISYDPIRVLYKIK